MKRDLAAERAERDAYAVDFLARWDAAADAVLNDAGVWLDEAQRSDAAPLPWPLRLAPRGWLQALGLLAEAKVIEVYAQIAAGAFGHALPPMDASDADFQALLRVVLRAAQAGEAALVAQYGGDRLSLAREFQKMRREVDAEVARRAGGSVRAGFRSAGLAPSTAYRAEARAEARARTRGR